jgi:hypothetical protein
MSTKTDIDEPLKDYLIEDEDAALSEDELTQFMGFWIRVRDILPDRARTLLMAQGRLDRDKDQYWDPDLGYDFDGENITIYHSKQSYDHCDHTYRDEAPEEFCFPGHLLTLDETAFNAHCEKIYRKRMVAVVQARKAAERETAEKKAKDAAQVERWERAQLNDLLAKYGEPVAKSDKEATR